MIDVIPNHMAWPGAHGTIDYTKFTPFNSQSFFHDFCELNKEIATAGPANATNILRKVSSALSPPCILQSADCFCVSSAGSVTTLFRFPISRPRIRLLLPS